MPRFVISKLVRALNEQGKALNGARVLLLGMAYKPNIDDLRESPALDVWALLEREWGALVSYHDPHIPEIRSLGAANTQLTPAALADVDVVIITTNHKDVDYDLVVEHAPLILDTRNALEHDAEHIVKL